MKRILVSVTNDLVTDQRVHKVCTTLFNNGFDILLIGRKLKNSQPLVRDYNTLRFKLFFNKGALFYAEYNLRLFFILLFLKKDILLSNDLDTLLANYMASKISKSKLVYDSHELFTEVPELIYRPFQQNFWLFIEQHIFPKLKYAYTVNEEIAKIYSDKYGVNVKVIRNIAPLYHNLNIDKNLAESVKGKSKMIILQGSGINIDRGAEEAVEMMQYLTGFVLYIIGSGDVIATLKSMVKDLALSNKVFFKDKMPYENLMEYTKIADLGLSLDKNTNLNYTLSSPNKVFDYIQANTPILTSNTKIISKLILDKNIGIVTNSHNPIALAKTVEDIFLNEQQYNIWCKNLKEVAKELNWENESKKLMEIFNSID
ncbi:glycosyltransferase [Lutibacter sp. HS1-25]|uniref:glycosyltransferase n=1 Tax=Lutibacter sp. HS1-25 TaxID=2485000 RepID=UPI0010109044|nr:glycosyltransferase [Lutibacter sp. HS1-25]RXP46566.1 glycosyltransferase [Lutibacter sp. HS1-25]